MHRWPRWLATSLGRAGRRQLESIARGPHHDCSHVLLFCVRSQQCLRQPLSRQVLISSSTDMSPSPFASLFLPAHSSPSTLSSSDSSRPCLFPRRMPPSVHSLCSLWCVPRRRVFLRAIGSPDCCIRCVSQSPLTTRVVCLLQHVSSAALCGLS